MKLRRLALTLALVLVAIALCAENGHPQSVEADIRAEVARFVENLQYAGSIRSLASSEFHYRTSPGVTVIVVTANDIGHSAIAIHEDLPDYPCAIRVGDIPPLLNDGADEGEATCRWPG